MCEDWTLDSEEAPSEGPLPVLVSHQDLVILSRSVNKETSQPHSYLLTQQQLNWKKMSPPD